jgi:hypothetical protein
LQNFPAFGLEDVTRLKFQTASGPDDLRAFVVSLALMCWIIGTGLSPRYVERAIFSLATASQLAAALVSMQRMDCQPEQSSSGGVGQPE